MYVPELIPIRVSRAASNSGIEILRYARMAGKPAFILLHVGRGFANGIADTHNAGHAKAIPSETMNS
jgi:hypothetical protein